MFGHKKHFSYSKNCNNLMKFSNLNMLRKYLYKFANISKGNKKNCSKLEVKIIKVYQQNHPKKKSKKILSKEILLTIDFFFPRCGDILKKWRPKSTGNQQGMTLPVKSLDKIRFKSYLLCE